MDETSSIVHSNKADPAEINSVSRLLLIDSDMTVTNEKSEKKKYRVNEEGLKVPLVACKVLLLDGTDFKISIPKASYGMVLFNKVCEFLNLMEKEYFSLTFKESKDAKVWLQNDKSISKQIKKLKWEFSFELKFYPQDPCSLREEISRYQVYLQIRVDILSGKLPCSFVSNSLLGGLACQSQLGDFDLSEHGHGIEYLAKMKFCPGQNEELVDKISEFHKVNRGMSASEAEYVYLENVKNMALYGLHMVQARDADNNFLSLGVSSSGLLLYKDRIRLNKFIWPKILNIAYKRNRLTMVIRGENKSSKQILSYKLANYTTVKRFWKLAVEHHTFFRLREPIASPRGVFMRKGPKYFSGVTQYQAGVAADKNKRESQNFSRVYYTMGRGGLDSGNHEPVPMTSTVDRAEQMISVDFSTVTLDRSKRNKTPIAYPDADVDRSDSGVRLFDTDGTATYSRNNASGGYPNNPMETRQRVSLNVNAAADRVGMTYSKTPYPVAPGYLTPGGGPGLVNPGYMTPSSAYGDGAPPMGYGSRMNTPSYQNNGQQFFGESTHLYGNTQKGMGNGYGANLGTDVFDANPKYPYDADEGMIPFQEDHWKQQGNQWGGDGEYNGYNGNAGNVGATKTMTRTYTTPDGSVVTETRTERDGIVETRVEKKKTFVNGEDEDEYDRLLHNAIKSVTDMNEDLSVEKIEITKGD